MSSSIDPQLLGLIRGADMNSTGDQAIPMNFSPGSKYRIDRIMATKATTVPTLAVGGIYTAPSKGGTAVVGALQTYVTLLNSNIYEDLVLASSVLDTLFSSSTLYLSLTVPQGAACGCDFYIYGVPVL